MTAKIQLLTLSSEVIYRGIPMSIKSVTNANLAEYVAERSIKPTEIQNGDQMTNAVTKIAEVKNPVVEAKETKPNAANAPDPGEQEPTAKKKNPVQPRIDELTAQKRELEEFAESEYELRLRAERRIGELENQLKEVKPEVKQEASKEDIEPDPTKYTDQKEFLKDWGAWNRKEAAKEFRAEQARQEQAKIQEQQNARIAAQIEQAKQDLPDFVEVIEAAGKENPFVPEHIKLAILDSDVGAHLAYHIRKNPEDEKRLYSLTPAKALLELGKLELKYLKEAKKDASANITSPQQTIETTKAPTPPPKLKGAEGGIVSTNLAAPMNFKDYRAQRLEQQRARNRR